MEKTRKKAKWMQIIIALILCFFCAFTFVGCFSVNTSGGSSGNSGSAGGSSGGSSGSGNTGGGGSSSGGNNNDDDKEKVATPNDVNDVFAGIIGVYEGDSTTTFADEYAGEISFEALATRQFTAFSSYILAMLNSIYGTSTESEYVITNAQADYGAEEGLSVNLTESNFKDANQKIISGLGMGNIYDKDGKIIDVSKYLNYKNAMNGGYELSVTPTQDAEGGTYSVLQATTYDTTKVVEGKAWKGLEIITTENMLRRALCYIYRDVQNQKVLSPHTETIDKLPVISDPSDEIDLTANEQLKQYYTTFDLSYILNNGIAPADFNQIGFSREYLWHVAYFLAYSIIGESNVDASINAYDKIFDANGNINTIEGQCQNVTIAQITDVKNNFQNYKGYNIIIKEIINNAVNMTISNKTVKFGSETDYFNGVNWETTLYPTLTNEVYYFYEKVEHISDANNPEVYDDAVVDEDDETAYEIYDHGTKLRLKRIILIPSIDTQKFNGTSFDVDGFMLGFKADDNAEFKVEVIINAKYNDGTSTDKNGVKVAINPYEDSIMDGTKIKVDDEFSSSIDCVEYDIQFEQQFKNAVTGGGNVFTETDLWDSFAEDIRSIEYDNGSSKTIKYGLLKVYNQLLGGGGIGIDKNVIEIEFKYYDKNDKELSSIPEAYLMYFYLYCA